MAGHVRILTDIAEWQLVFSYFYVKPFGAETITRLSMMARRLLRYIETGRDLCYYISLSFEICIVIAGIGYSSTELLLLTFLCLEFNHRLREYCKVFFSADMVSELHVLFISFKYLHTNINIGSTNF